MGKQEKKLIIQTEEEKMKKSIILIMLLSITILTSGQHLTGYVYELGESGEQVPLPAVNLHWSGTQTGTFSNEEGTFTLPRVRGINILVVSYVGYEQDSIKVNAGEKSISIGLSRNIALKTMVITARQTSTYMDHYSPMAVQHITGQELHKAACCNLGESFETNASVDVSYGDAISGAKRIELLGLAGVYSQLMIENIPDYQGYGSTFGLLHIPGHWLESISVSKGAASVLSGNESITGQVNANYKKPDGPERFYLNLYGNNHGHLEFNTNTSWRINNNLSSMLLAHGGYNDHKIDHNHDGFMDEPLTQRLHLMNRWLYNSSSGNLMSQWGINGLHEERHGGQLGYEKGDPDQTEVYGFEVLTRRYGGFAKGGYMFRNRAATNIATLNNFTLHDQDAYFGRNHHAVQQVSFNHRTIFDTYVGNTNHIVHFGGSFQYQDFAEVFNDSVLDRTEMIPGIFTQYTYSHLHKFTLMAGFRADFHNLHGFQWTPRIHLRYQPMEHTTLRFSAGKGYRTMNLFAEHLFLLANSRKIHMDDSPGQEIAWNYGLHVTHRLKIGGREASLNAEVFRTSFESQYIIDMDRDFANVYVYQLEGTSFANNFQIDFTMEPIKRFDLLLAIRASDVKATVDGSLRPVAFSKRYKGLVNFSYKTRLELWQFDFTTQFNGPSRLPDNTGLPAYYPRENQSPAYTIIHAQVTKYFRNWNIYIGGENLTNFVQRNPIIGTDDPFGSYFDASQIWGPVLGRKLYIGMRVKLDRKS
jgi:outer membrane receptor for ferrienterochelin and colicins